MTEPKVCNKVWGRDCNSVQDVSEIQGEASSHAGTRETASTGRGALEVPRAMRCGIVTQNAQ